jgi:hypothetical protein
MMKKKIYRAFGALSLSFDSNEIPSPFHVMRVQQSEQLALLRYSPVSVLHKLWLQEQPRNKESLHLSA